MRKIYITKINISKEELIEQFKKDADERFKDCELLPISASYDDLRQEVQIKCYVAPYYQEYYNLKNIEVTTE